jgi:zinc transporter ZupT
MDQHTILIAFVLTLLAGLSTGIGSLLALIAKRTNTKFLCASLGFSAGVMLYVSFMEITPILDFCSMKYHFFDVPTKLKRHKEIFPIELERAFSMGTRLVE